MQVGVSLKIDPGHGHATRQASDRLRDLILKGQISPGARIAERMVQEQLGITRTPLREALKVLAAEGLVTIIPNRGAVVAELSAEDAHAAFELLGVLDGEAGALAAERATDDEINHIAALHERMVAAYQSRDLATYFRLNKDIHLAIVDAAGNAALARVYRSESARVDRLRYESNREPAVWARSIRQHEQILEALSTRQGALLRALLISHRRSGWELAKAAFGRETE
ncbi:MAG: hypothetical protein RL291_2131 [Pseudomonadota bacterium]|jgi:DNA-binding GntR family transcriptional regulator